MEGLTRKLALLISSSIQFLTILQLAWRKSIRDRNTKEYFTTIKVSFIIYNATQTVKMNKTKYEPDSYQTNKILTVTTKLFTTLCTHII